jgi:geranylgeranyl diphosphate synthase type II
VNFESYLAELRRLVEARLGRYLDAETACPAKLREAMRYCLLAPGKRLRPMLALMAAEAVGGRAEDALPAACAIEMVHTYSLVHDDLPAMDDDDLRRGLPTCHKKFGEATAILVGDALLTLAFQVLSEDVPFTAVAAGCCADLAKAAGVAGMVGGQMDDLAAEKRSETSLEMLESIHRRKTAALFRAAVRLAGRIGLAGRERADWMIALDRYAACLGLAFQISDDLLDVEGETARTGKSVKKDAGRGKLTYPGLLGIEESRRRLLAVGREAREHLTCFGEAGGRLASLVQRIVERDR